MSKQAAQSTTNQITEGVIWKQLLIFFFPILFGTFFQQLYNTADAIIVGNFVGKEALASVGGSASTIINLLVGFFVGLSQTTGAGSGIPFIPQLHWPLQGALSLCCSVLFPHALL